MTRTQLLLVALAIIGPSATWASEPQLLIAVGTDPSGTEGSVLPALTERLAGTDAANTTVVFTGNYSDDGALPEDGHRDRASVEADLMRHIEAVRAFADRGGRIVFIPGHRDFGDSAPVSVERMKAFVDRQLYGASAERTAMPVVACGEPALIKLSSDAVLAVLNSQWFMSNFDADPRFNEGCAFKSRGQLGGAVNDLVKRWRGERLVFAMHHPLESFGGYGGRFGLIDHVVPPVFGTVAVWARQSGLTPQHRDHVVYDRFSEGVFAAAQKFGGFVFVSGHDRSLQYVKRKDQAQIIAGAANDPTRVVSVGKEHFAQRASGWAELTLGTDADAVELVDGVTGSVLHQRALPPITQFGGGDLGPPPPVLADTATSTYAQGDFAETGFLNGIFLGEHYRDAYKLELEFPVLDLKAEGFSPFSAGGGNQTNSLFLFDENKGQWVARSVTKDTGRFLPYPLNQLSIVNTVLADAFTATHPAGAMSVPPMATAIGMYHTRPRLVYVPDQVGAEPYRGFIMNEVALLERRARRPKEGPIPENLGAGDSPIKEVTFEGGDDILQLLRSDPWTHRIDQAAMLEARLLDIYIGDWDRHEGQWNFAGLHQPDGTVVHRAVPEDRDQVFSHYDGFALWLARVMIPQSRVLRPFKDEVTGLTWLIYGSRHFDPVLLNRLNKDEWMASAQKVQDALTDEVIHEAMMTWPKKAYELDGKDIERKLRARRDSLLEVAEAYFDRINRRIDVIGSESDDDVRVEFLSGGRVRLELARRGTAQVYYARMFEPRQTKEIRLYTLAGDDRLTVSGEPHRRINVRFLPGAGQDEIVGAKGERLRAKAIKVYDLEEGITLAEGVEVAERFTESSYRLQYDRYDPHNEPFTLGFIPLLNGNPDDGIALGGIAIGTATGFKRRPFASRHTIAGEFYSATLGARASYEAFFPNTLGTLDQTVTVAITTPLFTRNFFGITNDFVDPRDNRRFSIDDGAGSDFSGGDRNFYRLRLFRADFDYGPSLRLADDIVRIGLDLTGHVVDIDDTDDRFILTDAAEAEFRDQVDELSARFFAGARLSFAVDSRANRTYPKKGFTFEATAAFRTDLTDGREYDSSATFTGAVGTHLPFDRDGRVVLTSRARASTILGDHPFYFFPTVGSRDLRAFNFEQFAGTTVFAQTTDLRFEVFKIQNGLPGNVGLAASIDHGRAFGENIAGVALSDDYHASWGATVFWNVFGLFGLSGSYHRSFSEPGGPFSAGQAERVVVGIGPQFAETGFIERL